MTCLLFWYIRCKTCQGCQSKWYGMPKFFIIHISHGKEMIEINPKDKCMIWCLTRVFDDQKHARFFRQQIAYLISHWSKLCIFQWSIYYIYLYIDYSSSSSLEELKKYKFEIGWVFEYIIIYPISVSFVIEAIDPRLHTVCKYSLDIYWVIAWSSHNAIHYTTMLTRQFSIVKFQCIVIAERIKGVVGFPSESLSKRRYI